MVSAEENSATLRAGGRVDVDLLPKLPNTETDLESVQPQPRDKNELLLLFRAPVLILPLFLFKPSIKAGICPAALWTKLSRIASTSYGPPPDMDWQSRG